MYKKSRLVRVRGFDGRMLLVQEEKLKLLVLEGGEVVDVASLVALEKLSLSFNVEARISERRKRLLSEIEDVHRTRAVQRAGRKRRGDLDAPGLDTIAVVGYTNAGKSTLVSALSDSDLYSDDRLFATVDPRVRGVTLPSGRKVLLSDTVGFISDLPLQLVEAFHATLEEVVEADLLVHVLDSSASNLEEQRQAVLDVLRQIGVPGKKIQDMLEVWNKIDLQSDTNSEREDFNDDHEYKFVKDESEVADEQQLHEDKMEDQRIENSSGWLGKEDIKEEEEDPICPPVALIGSDKREFIDESRTKEKSPDCHPESEHTLHVKTSAVTGAGLQELLELIDEKLLHIDKEHQLSQRETKRSEFDRKWRPPQSEKMEVAVD